MFYLIYLLVNFYLFLLQVNLEVLNMFGLMLKRKKISKPLIITVSFYGLIQYFGFMNF